MPEIKSLTSHSSSTVFKYIKGIEVLPEFEEALRIKQGGSKERARIKWDEAKRKARGVIGVLSERDHIMLMAGLYWGEGSKKAFSFINGDPYLVKSYIQGLLFLGVRKEEIRLNFRIFSDMDRNIIARFWVDSLGFKREQVGWFEVVESTGQKKLPYGMCRVNVIKGAVHFKLIMSMIDFIKSST